MSVKHPRWRALRLWLIVRVIGGHFENQRRCGCVDFHPHIPRYPRQAGQPWSNRLLACDPHFGPTFHLIPCDTCGPALMKMLKAAVK